MNTKRYNQEYFQSYKLTEAYQRKLEYNRQYSRNFRATEEGRKYHREYERQNYHDKKGVA